MAAVNEDKLTEALAYFDQLHATQGEHADRLQLIVKDAARRWASFPTDDDVEAAIAAMVNATADREGHIPEESILRAVHLGMRAALEAVKREDR